MTWLNLIVSALVYKILMLALMTSLFLMAPIFTKRTAMAQDLDYLVGEKKREMQARLDDDRESFEGAIKGSAAIAATLLKQCQADRSQGSNKSNVAESDILSSEISITDGILASAIKRLNNKYAQSANGAASLCSTISSEAAKVQCQFAILKAESVSAIFQNIKAMTEYQALFERSARDLMRCAAGRSKPYNQQMEILQSASKENLDIIESFLSVYYDMANSLLN